MCIALQDYPASFCWRDFAFLLHVDDVAEVVFAIDNTGALSRSQGFLLIPCDEWGAEVAIGSQYGEHLAGVLRVHIRVFLPVRAPTKAVREH